MKKNPIYESPKNIKGSEDRYGTKVTAFFYVGDRIIEVNPLESPKRMHISMTWALIGKRATCLPNHLVATTNCTIFFR